MSKAIFDLATEIKMKHFPGLPANVTSVDAFENTHNCSLPEDMRQFLLACDGASLFRPAPAVPPFRLLSLQEICRARIALFGDDSPKYGNESHFVFCDRGDGDYVGIDLATREGNHRKIFDVWHEAYPDMEQCSVIADSFTCFLELALGSNGDSLFWLK